jgi:hypothetical protein
MPTGERGRTMPFRCGRGPRRNDMITSRRARNRGAATRPHPELPAHFDSMPPHDRPRPSDRSGHGLVARARPLSTGLACRAPRTSITGMSRLADPCPLALTGRRLAERRPDQLAMRWNYRARIEVGSTNVTRSSRRAVNGSGEVGSYETACRAGMSRYRSEGYVTATRSSCRCSRFAAVSGWSEASRPAGART